MRVFKPGQPDPELWQTHDIHAPDDAAATTAAKALYDQLWLELVRSGARHGLAHFNLAEGGRLVCKGH